MYIVKFKNQELYKTDDYTNALKVFYAIRHCASLDTLGKIALYYTGDMVKLYGGEAYDI